MLTILIRTLLIYVILNVTMRLMGKRQLGELEVSELITTLLLSEIASLPIVDQSIPVMHAIIPLVTILFIEILLSVVLLKCPMLKNLASARPSVLVRRGKIDQKELRRNRITLGELVSEVRQSGLSSLSDVDYAIVEQNGKLSVLPKKSAQPPTAKDLKQPTRETGIVHILIEDGKVDPYNMQLLELNEEWLAQQLKLHGKAMASVFFLGIDDAGTLYWIDKEESA